MHAAVTPARAQAELPTDLDVAIIGAGGAGISAGRVCQSAGAKFAIFEARERIGGRCTSENAFPVPVDIGAEWFQWTTIKPSGRVLATNNPLFDLAVAAGWPVQPDLFDRQLYRDHKPVSPADPQALEFSIGYLLGLKAIAAAGAAASKPGAPSSADISVAAATQPIFATTGFPLLLAASLENQDGATLDRLSTLDAFRLSQWGSDVSVPSLDNWKTPKGYGNFLAALANGLPIYTNTVVTRVSWDGTSGVELTTTGGTVTAKKVIMTLPMGVLQQGFIDRSLTFAPALPADVVAAINGLPMGAVNKIALEYSTNGFGDAGTSTITTLLEENSVGYVVEAPLWDANVAVCIVGGPIAAEIETREGALGLIRFGTEAVEKIFGKGGTVVRAATSTWVTDPFSRGAYTYATPGHTACRSDLNPPLAERLWFAGEAVSVEMHGSLVGAWTTGRDSATQALSSLGITVPA